MARSERDRMLDAVANMLWLQNAWRKGMSRRRRRTVSNDEIVCHVWLRTTSKSTDARAADGRVFFVHGCGIEVFPISVLAYAIERRAGTIIGWERRGLFPTPMWHVPDRRTKRWYSRAQIDAIRSIQMFGGQPELDLEGFCRNVREVFHTIDASIVNLHTRSAPWREAAPRRDELPNGT